MPLILWKRMQYALLRFGLGSVFASLWGRWVAPPLRCFYYGADVNAGGRSVERCHSLLR
jgi:hypothetical protein